MKSAVAVVVYDETFILLMLDRQLGWRRAVLKVEATRELRIEFLDCQAGI
jgi:hypothetical protein